MIAAWEADAEGAPTGAPLARDAARAAWDAEAARAWLALDALAQAAPHDEAAAEALAWLEGTEPGLLRERLATLEPAADWLDSEAQGLHGVAGARTGRAALDALEWLSDRHRAWEAGPEVGALLTIGEDADYLLAAWIDAGGRERTGAPQWWASSRTDAEIAARLAGVLDALAALERAAQARDAGQW